MGLALACKLMVHLWAAQGRQGVAPDRFRVGASSVWRQHPLLDDSSTAATEPVSAVSDS
jgi:hypothetical protein